jgi:hypothetical protein
MTLNTLTMVKVGDQIVISRSIQSWGESCEMGCQIAFGEKFWIQRNSKIAALGLFRL